MAENENVVETTQQVQPEPTEPSKGKKAGAAVKEWFRKFIVKLKRQTHMIPLVVILITSLVYLCGTGVLAQAIEKNSNIPNLGIAMFVNTLASILVLVVFLNAFPKRSKPKLVFIIGVFAVLVLILGMDLLYVLSAMNAAQNDPIGPDTFLSLNDAILPRAFIQLYVHMAFVGVSIVVFALLPVYKKGINKINTRKVLEENNLSEDIDTSAEV